MYYYFCVLSNEDKPNQQRQRSLQDDDDIYDTIDERFVTLVCYIYNILCLFNKQRYFTMYKINFS